MYRKKTKKYLTGGELAIAKGAMDLGDSLVDELGTTLDLEDDTIDIIKSSKFGALGTGYGVARKVLNDNRNRKKASLSVQQMSKGGSLRELDFPSHENGGGNIGQFGIEDNINPIAELELNETIYNNDYVFSDRLRSEDGKTFAEKSKKIKKKYDKLNPDSKATLKVMMDDLKIEQEGKRIQFEEKNMLRQMRDGGPLANDYLFPANNLDLSLLDGVDEEPSNNPLLVSQSESNTDDSFSKRFDFFDRALEDEMTPALIGKGVEAGIQALQAFKPAEQQNLYLNPEADNVRSLSNNKIDLQQAFNDQNLEVNAARQSILNNARGDGNVLSNLQMLGANAMRGRSQLSLSQQEIDADLNLANASALNNLGQQEVNARLTRADIQSANDARKRDAIRAVGNTIGNAGAFMTNKKVNDLRGSEILKTINAMYDNFGTAETNKEYKRIVRDKNGNIIRYKKLFKL